MKIAFHDNIISLQGTSIVIYDHAYYTRKYLGYDPIIMYNTNYHNNNEDALNKFKKEFKVYGYNNINQIDKILEEHGCDVFFMIKHGKWDNVISNVCKNWINAVGPCGNSDIHGDVFAMGSAWLSELTNWQIPYVPHMVNLPESEENLRQDLNIPKDALVVGCHGAIDAFDISFAKEALYETILQRSDMWFVSLFVDIGINHERIIRLEPSSDLLNKVKFINTCDIMLHARYAGESFGLACAEFSSKNKPVITYSDSMGKNHLKVLGEKAFTYKNKQDVLNILQDLDKKQINCKEWNMYQEYTPEKVIAKFDSIYKL